VRGLVTLLLGLLAASSVVLAPGVSQAWSVELLRYLPYPAWIGVGVLALVLSLRLNWLWRAASAAGLLLVAWPLMGLQLHGGEAGSGRLRVMTYNIKSYHASGAGAFARIAWEVVQHDPDILVMQDAGMVDLDQRSENESVRTMLRDRKLYDFGQYIVASRLPLQGCKPGDISYRGEPHTYVRCTVLVRGREIDLITAHLLSPREGLNATRHDKLEGLDDWRQNYADRLSQARKLVQDIVTTPAPAAAPKAASKGETALARPRPLIVAGDLNAPESSPVIQALLDVGLRDAYSAAGNGYGYTHGHSLRLGFSFLRIDHILVSQGFGVADSFVGGKEGSEHRPVIADLWLDRP
jgi:endonuclease/exonuclease/phosphatase (EEP) superfamily protein YafD